MRKRGTLTGQMGLFDMPRPMIGGCGDCVCISCLMYWSRRCPVGVCWDDWRADHQPYPGPERKTWTNWQKPGEQERWCRGGTFYAAEEGCGKYVPYRREETKARDCLGCVVVVYQDGFVRCDLIDCLGGCEKCMEDFERRLAAWQ